jgi:hypothetical protein
VKATLIVIQNDVDFTEVKALVVALMGSEDHLAINDYEG